jgi:hypothetical protein
MPYIAEHEKSCKDQSRYLVKRIKIEIENCQGAILDNSDPGWVSSTQCASCNAPAKWKKVS